MGGPSLSIPGNEACKDSAGSHSSAAGTWLPCECGAEE